MIVPDAERRACIACLERVLEVGAGYLVEGGFAGVYYLAIQDELKRLRGNSPEKPESSKRPPTTAELYGSDPDFTGGLTTEEYIEEIRG